MNWNWIGNDTIALVGMISVAILGLVTGSENTVAVAIGAIGGYIGSKATTTE